MPSPISPADEPVTPFGRLAGRPDAVAVLFVPMSPESFTLSVQALLDRTELPVVVGVLYPQFGKVFDGFGPRVIWRPVGSVSELVNKVHAELGCHVVVVNDAVELPPDPFRTAFEWIDDDLRVATVSFLSNAADFLSFPIRNLPVDRPPEGHDEVSVTRLLRESTPAADRAPIMYAAGPVVVLSRTALRALGELQAPHSARFDVAVADFSARGRAKGFVDLCDTSTFLTRPSDVAVAPIGESLSHDDRGWLLHRHQSLIAFLDDERMSGDSPFALAHQVARVKVTGLQVLVDGACFGPHQVGTQVATLHTIEALAARDDVARVSVALPGPVPHYAAAALAHPKVRALAAPGGDLSAFGLADVAFRPYQPVPGWDVECWRAAGIRLVVSMLDTIAFHNGGYFASTANWLAYRRVVHDVLRAVDGVSVISGDVAEQLRLHRLPIDTDRVAVVPLGTEHLQGDEHCRIPAELLARGFVAGEFALCLGVNYTHKNRELALAAHQLLRGRGFDMALVLAGASVPHGTTRLAEAAATRGVDDVYVIPELAPEERNWLLRHASLVWYPTSAEGFGFVPFEAARFGTPGVAVGFGPLNELGQTGAPHGAGAVPVSATDWSPGALADAAERLLRDPDLARRHLEAVLTAGGQYTWTGTAGSYVRWFRELLGRPRR